jgi:hypothetical protein
MTSTVLLLDIKSGVCTLTRMRRYRLIPAGAVMAAATALGLMPLSAKVDFAHDVVPILKDNCVRCHGGKESKGGLSINSRRLLLESDTVIVGKPDQSIFIELLETGDLDERMPSAKKGEKQKPPLKKKEIETLRHWIAEGANWQDGFSFEEERYKPPLKPRRPVLPTGKNGENALDRIVRAYFKKHQVNSPEEVSDASYIRRLSFDVLGLPPTPTEVQAFVSDKATDKRARLVDTLLARDQQFAEHWMTFWNDLLRNAYSGTGFIDGGRSRITDWLYLSLLENKPYDRFVRELIAPTKASEGFIRGIKWRGNVNASQSREIQFSQSVSQVFLGINMKCASCHDSFIDEWTLKDAYGLAAVVSDKPMEMFRCDKPTGKVAHATWLFPELGAIDATKSQDERLKQLAGLMTHPENGRMQRTLVNRLWKQMMGRGIVHPVDAMGSEPWNEDLLDYLGVYLVDQKYDLKKVIALIAKSKTYQLKAEIAKEAKGAYVFKGPIMKRMTAEQFLDSIRTTTGVWPQPGKNAKRQVAAVMKAHGLKKWDGRPLRAAFTRLDTLQGALGRPNREQIVSARPDLVTTLEAITLANGPQLASILSEGAKMLASKGSQDDLVQQLYLAALSRVPTSNERRLAGEIMGRPVTQHGVEDLLWTLFMLPEFQFIN